MYSRPTFRIFYENAVGLVAGASEAVKIDVIGTRAGKPAARVLFLAHRKVTEPGLLQEREDE